MLKHSLEQVLATYDVFNIRNDIGTILLLRETFKRHFRSGNILGRVLNILGTSLFVPNDAFAYARFAILIALELATHTAKQTYKAQLKKFSTIRNFFIHDSRLWNIIPYRTSWDLLWSGFRCQHCGMHHNSF